MSSRFMKVTLDKILAKHPRNFVRILPVVFSFCRQDAVTGVLMPKYSPSFVTTQVQSSKVHGSRLEGDEN